jgi:iron complex outermembrane receptor protein
VKKLILLCSTAAILPTAAFAQSTGSQEFEKEAIIVTGTRSQEVGGIQAPDAAKSKAVLTQEMIARQNPGQSILDTVNLVPGVSFQNNDAYGSSGGTLTIRGFSQDRVSLTFDGIPLNDSGNYAIYSNQQLDPELIDQVNVNLGSTDVDSPTASATGGTVNYRTRNPATKFGGRVFGSLGEYDFRRIFALVDTGEVTSMGTRAWFAVSTAKNDNPFNNYGKVDKQQYNGKIYQPIGSNGDFVSVSGHYNQNRNNFFGSVRLRDDLPTPSGFPSDSDEREYNILYPCTIDEPQGGVQDVVNGCGDEFDRRFNPSNTGNVRINSRFAITDKLTLTVDPSYQYVKANGGGTVIGREGARVISGVAYTGFIGGNYYFGGDINGDGDVLDTCRNLATAGQACSSTASGSNNPNGGVRLIAPSQTRTHRFGVIANLRYKINDDHLVRASYTFDHANHRQTGELGLLQMDGTPFDVFPVNDPLVDGFVANPIQKRDRQSYAILHQIAGEWVGSFFEDRLTINAGARLPFFKRDLDQNCFTTSATGFVDCLADPSLIDDYAAANPGFSAPQKRVLKYDKLLPNVGVVFDVNPRISVFGSYAKGISVPSTDNLYNAFFFAEDSDAAAPAPETTDSFDGGVRYRSSKVQGQIGLWYTKFNDRLASSYDPELNASVFRNLGRVDKWGLDASAAWAPARWFTGYVFGSLNKSEIKENIQTGGGAGFDCETADPTTPTTKRNCAFTEGKYESGSPKYTYGASTLFTIGDLDFGVTAKRTGPRYIYDTNEPILNGDVDVPAGITQLFPSKTDPYWLVHLDARYNLRKLVGLERSFLALNVYNLFNETYVGGFTAGLNQTVSSAGVYGSAPFAQIGAPRTISGSLNIEW